MLKERQPSGNMIGNGVVPGTSAGTSSARIGEEHNFAPFTNIRIMYVAKRLRPIYLYMFISYVHMKKKYALGDLKSLVLETCSFHSKGCRHNNQEAKSFTQAIKMIVLCLLILLISRKPLIPLMSIKARMATRKVIKLSRLHMKTKSSDVQDNDWITVGVIITKSEPKMSSKVKRLSLNHV